MTPLSQKIVSFFGNLSTKKSEERAMRKTTTLKERPKIITLSESEIKDQAIEEKMGWSLSVVRKWRRPYKKEGRQGLVRKMGRPKKRSAEQLSRRGS